MCESSGSQYFRTTAGLQSELDTFDESRLIMTFFIILGVIKILSFKLVLEGKTGKEIPESSRLEFLENFLGNSFALSEVEGIFNEQHKGGELGNINENILLSLFQIKKISHVTKENS